MSPRTVFVNFFLEVAGFMAVIPPSSGISCYVKDCTYYPDRDPFCRDSGLVACLDKDDDRCGTLSFILMSSNIETRIWNCSRSTHDDCNEEATCDYMKELAAGMDDTVDACTLTCCEGDGCNDPGKKLKNKLGKKKKDEAGRNLWRIFHWPPVTGNDY